MKRLLVLIGLLALGAPAAFAAPPAGTGNSGVSATSSDPTAAPTPSALCREQLKTMGAATFRLTYAPTGNGKNAFGKCVASQKLEANENAANAAKDCKKERADLGVDAFADKYGANENKRNAFGKCVSTKVREETQEDQAATLNAAKQCKKERSDLGVQSFATKYGTNAGKKNAFAKCVSGKVKASDSEDGD